jgi:hypothetical protein
MGTVPQYIYIYFLFIYFIESELTWQRQSEFSILWLSEYGNPNCVKQRHKGSGIRKGRKEETSVACSHTFLLLDHGCHAHLPHSFLGYRFDGE